MKKVQFPQKLSFACDPVATQSAVDALEPVCRTVSPLQNTHEELAKQLMSIPQAKLQKWKMKKAAQELLPYLIIEARSNPPLKERMNILLTHLFPSLKPRIQVRVLSYALDWSDVRKSAYQSFSQHPPSEQSPPWLRTHWKRILRPEPPEENMVTLLRENRVPLFNVLPWLGLSPYAPMVESLYLAYWEELDPQDLMGLDFGQVCRFLESSAPPSIRSRLLAWILQEYVTGASLDVLDSPFRKLFEIGQHLWGSPHRSGWRQCAAEIKQIALWFEHERELRRFFDEERWGWWRTYLPFIRRLAERENILLIDLGTWVAAEKKEAEQSCGWYRHSHVSLPLKEPDEVWRRGEYWRESFQRRMSERLSV
ncbi:MAG: hypothetical protein VX278_07385 [Myxococcota bacterium]|nr:hypothetical protein [Myxococcota bacterium]